MTTSHPSTPRSPQVSLTADDQRSAHRQAVARALHPDAWAIYDRRPNLRSQGWTEESLRLADTALGVPNPEVMMLRRTVEAAEQSMAALTAERDKAHGDLVALRAQVAAIPFDRRWWGPNGQDDWTPTREHLHAQCQDLLSGAL